MEQPVWNNQSQNRRDREYAGMYSKLEVNRLIVACVKWIVASIPTQFYITHVRKCTRLSLHFSWAGQRSYIEYWTWKEGETRNKTNSNSTLLGMSVRYIPFTSPPLSTFPITMVPMSWGEGEMYGRGYITPQL